MASVRPPLKYAGGKSWLVGLLHELTAGFESYYEPFAGAGNAGINMFHRRRILADINPDLVEVLRCCTIDPAEFRAALEEIWAAYPNDYEGYARARRDYNRLIECGCVRTVSDVALFVWLNRHGFNGLLRYNRKGFLNVPFGHYKNPLPPLESAAACFTALQGNVGLRVGDYEQTCLDAPVHHSVIYCDPPYLPKGGFSGYHWKAFDMAEHERLAAFARRNRMMKGNRVLVSGSDCPETRAIYSQDAAHVYTLSTLRSVAAKSSARGVVGELLFVYES